MNNNTNIMTTTTEKAPIAITKNLEDSVRNLLAATAYKETLQPIVDGYKREWFANNNPTPRKQLKDIFKTVDFTNLSNDYMMTDEDFVKYDAFLQKQYDENGFEDRPEGTCPLLIAESLERDAQREMVEQAKYITRISADMLYSSKMENWKKAHKLIIGMVISHPSTDFSSEAILNKYL